MYQPLARIRIVLINTSHPGNVGAAARAMKTMGLSRLYLVQPSNYPGAEATARAVGADDVLESACICNSLDQALAGCVLVIGTSARSRRLEWPCVAPAECAQLLLQYAGKEDVALVFGRESAGLTNEELDRCHYMTSISTNPAYSSLNLAAAVQVFAYELRRVLEAGLPQDNCMNEESRGSANELEGFYLHFQTVLSEIGVIADKRPKPSLLRRLRRIFNRTGLTQTELNILRGILTAIQNRNRANT